MARRTVENRFRDVVTIRPFEASKWRERRKGRSRRVHEELPCSSQTPIVRLANPFHRYNEVPVGKSCGGDCRGGRKGTAGDRSGFAPSFPLAACCRRGFAA